MSNVELSHSSDQKLLDSLSRVLMNKLQQNPNLSIQALANKADVSYNTIHRIINRKSVPAIEQVFKIVSTLSDEASIQEIIDNCPEGVRGALKKVYSVLYEENKDCVISQNVDRLIEDENSFIVYSLAANRSGTTREVIKDTLGRIGLEKLEFLITSGIVKESEGKIEALNKNFAVNFDTAKKQLSNYARFYSPNKYYNYLHSYSESVNKDGLNAVIDAHQEFHKKMSNIMNDEKFDGKIPVFSVAFTDMFDRSIIDQELACTLH